jgi:phosphoribosylanthranilate isomerase
MAIVAVCGITTLADAQTAKVNGACPSGLITCEEWCKHYRPLNLQDCLENHPRSCKAQFSKIGGKEACLPDRPPTSF